MNFCLIVTSVTQCLYNEGLVAYMVISIHNIWLHVQFKCTHQFGKNWESKFVVIQIAAAIVCTNSFKLIYCSVF